MAMIASFISIICAIYAIVAGIIENVQAGIRPIDLFQYFTTDANAITALSVSMILPYTIDGFRKKDFIVQSGQYSFTI